MFTIHTAGIGEAYHTLTPSTRLVQLDPDLGHWKEFRIAVRVDYGRSPDPYTFKVWLDDSTGVGDEPVEVIDDEELKRRQDHAIENGDTYTPGGTVYVVRTRSVVWRQSQAIMTHFRALMALNLFSLPANF